MSTHPRSETLPALTSLRFFAALWVVFYHFMRRSGGPFDDFLELGFVAVPFFFLLSGFILGRVYLTEGKPIDAKRFYASRFARIYPLYLLTLLLDLPRYVHAYGIVKHVGWGTIVSSVVASIFMVQAWHPSLLGLNGPAWSLSVEAFFYLIFPFAGPVLWKMRGRWVVPAMLFVVVLALVVTGLTSPTKFTYDPLRDLPTFVAGILLSKASALISASKPKREMLERLALALVLVCILCLFGATRLLSYSAFLQNGLLIPVFGILILAFTVKSRMAKLLSAGWLVLLGEASYGLYLFHAPAREYLQGSFEQHFSVIFPLYLAGIVLLSILSFKYLEKPARTWVLKKAGYIPKETLLASSVA